MLKNFVKKSPLYSFSYCCYSTTLIHRPLNLSLNNNNNNNNIMSSLGHQQERKYALTLDKINPHVVKLEYAVRGPIVVRAGQIMEDLKTEEGRKKWDFKEVVKCNIGDCHATGQKPLTFLRQVLACVSWPEGMMDRSDVPEDAKQRARRILDGCGGKSVGSYSDSCGVKVIREDVAAYITERDGLPCDFENIFLSTGASTAVKSVLELISTGGEGAERAGIMVPIPQYPLYSATNAEYNAFQIGYYLDEDNGWGLSEGELERALGEAAGQCKPRALVAINPGNPTGQVLDRSSMEAVIRVAYKHGLLVMADEVYQHNVYVPNKTFLSFKRVLHDMGAPYNQDVALASFMSASKGFMGECGLRGGYGELVNFAPEVRAQLFKLLTASLCSSVLGQTVMDVVVNPPKAHEPSFELFEGEKRTILDQLGEKARLVSATFNAMPGFSCNVVEGAMYAFPRLQLPPKAIAAAKAEGVAPDFLYCRQLLEAKGVCIVPGSGFGQKEGTYHFRTTILPSVTQMQGVMKDIKEFHGDFMRRYE